MDWNEFSAVYGMAQPFLKLDQLTSKHHPRWLDALRVATGLILHLKTLLFLIGSTPDVPSIIAGLEQPNKGFIWTIGTILMITGTFLSLGLQTRIVCLLTLPCLIASTLFSAFHSPLNILTFDLLLSILLLFLVCIFFVEGSGRFSVDYYMRHSKNTYVADKAKKHQPVSSN